MTKNISKVFSVIMILALMLALMPMHSVEAVSPDIVISQVYGAGGNSGAVLRNDYVELFNRGTTSVSLTGLSIQYTSATGTGLFSQQPIVLLSGSLAAGQYYLVQLASGGANGALLPTADATGTINMAAGGGKVILASSTSGVACNGSSTPCSAAQLASIKDLVGWDGANFFETTPAPSTSTSTAIFRNSNGCAETDNNGTDFAAAAPAPRNTASTLNPCPLDAAPEVSSTTPANGSAAFPLDGNISITFSEAVNVTGSWFTLSCATSGVHTATTSGGPTTFTLEVDTDFVRSEICTLTVSAANVTDQDSNDPPDTMAADSSFSFSTFEICGDPAALIHAVQGNGSTSPIAGSVVAIEGVVVGDYQATGQFGGYHVQEDDAQIDGDLATSEGIFIFSNTPVSAGDKVRVRGTVTEFVSSGQPLTELASVNNVIVCSNGNSVTSANVTLPVSALSDWERYEGMLVSIAQDLTVTETFTLGRFGEVALSVGGRLLNPTMITTPGPAAIAQQNLNDRSRILLDDGNNQQNIDPTIYPASGLSASNTLRSGYIVDGLTGVLEQRFGVYRVQPIGAVTFNSTNPRPTAPDLVIGRVRVAAMNVLNYFTTLNQSGNVCGPSNLECRGANTAGEFTRQRNKILPAMLGLEADVIGLMELENNATAAIQDLVNGLNAATAPGTYAFIDTGTIGTDAIKVGLIYRTTKVTPVGAHAILDSTDDPLFIDTLNRPVLAQTFEENQTGERFTVAVNHLKSKGSACVGDPDTGDGQGNCNITRTNAAIAEANWLAGDPTGSGDPDFLLIGDFNAYLMENPITALQSAGYTNLIDSFVGADAYSFVFQGQSGYLDHALANSSLTSQVAGATEWHVNADEPIVLDYNTEFKTANHVNTLYAPDSYRSSDHDPLIVGLFQYDFNGFFQPIDNLPTFNTVKAGSGVPVKFSLNGDYGLNIFAAGFPKSQPIACDLSSADAVEETVTTGGSSLSYDPLTDQYTYIWKTNKNWAGTCRQLVLQLNDGTTHYANFQFK